MITVDSESFLAVVSVAALAALIGGLAGRRVLVPLVAVEIVLGILIGPEVLGLATPDEFLDFFASLGLAAGILSTLIYPFVGLRQRGRRVVEAGS